MPESEAIAWREILRREVGPLVRLAIPVVAAEVAWMAMGLVDTLMVGRVSPVALGAVGLGHALFFAISCAGIGILLSLDYFVARAHGARESGVHHLVQGLWLAALMSPPLMAILALSPLLLRWMGVDAPVVVEVDAYLDGLVWSLPALLVYTAARRYLQAVELAREVMIVIVAANLLNLVADWALIFGHLGFAPMGALGAGWATFVSRAFMGAALVGLAAARELRGPRPPGLSALKPDWGEMAELLRLGLPAAGQMLLEVGMFSGATLLVGLMDPISLAAHQVALTIASFTFMMPLGVSSAGAVRVGHGLGRGDAHGAAGAGWAALALGAGCMAVSAAALALFRGPIVRAFTPDPEVLPVGMSLLLVAAIFQLADAVQVVAAGILRGVGDTRTPMIANLVGHWLLGLPVGATLAFALGWGAVGLWSGMCVGLSCVASWLLLAWLRRTRALERPA